MQLQKVAANPAVGQTGNWAAPASQVANGATISTQAGQQQQQQQQPAKAAGQQPVVYNGQAPAWACWRKR